ncbi:hypothetical protein [Rhizobacter sp. P5_C2]
MEWKLASQMALDLDRWRGQSIVQMTRYLMDLPESVPSLYGIDPPKVFRNFPAPVRLQLSSGAAYAVAVDTSQAAIVLSDTREMDWHATDFRATLEATDPIYADSGMRQALGAEISSLRIFVHPAKNVKHAVCARESLGLLLANGRTLLLSCGLHDESDDFSILYLDEVPAELRSRLTSVSIG